MSQPNIIPLDFTIVQFEPMEEHWNEYNFSDGTMVKFRTLVTRIAKKRDSPAGQFDISFNNIIMVNAPSQERGQPSPPIMPQDFESLDKFEVKPITNAEHWNVYRLVSTDDILKVKYVANAFYKAKNKFDQFGEPMYFVTGGPLVVPQPKTGKQSKNTP